MGFLYSYKHSNTSKQKKTYKLTEFTFPLDINISAKEFEKLSKYKDIQIELERILQLKTSIIPIFVGALGSVKKGTEKNLKKQQNHVKNTPSSSRRFWVETQQLDCSKPRTKETIITVIIIITICENIKTKCRIFQDNSLFALLLCLSLVSLSYKFDYKLDWLLKTVKTFSDDIRMTFGLDKCAKATFIKGKLKYTISTVLDMEMKAK